MSKKVDVSDKIKDITELVADNRISVKEVQDLSNIDYPLFSFKYLHKISYNESKETSFFISFLQRLQKLSELGWKNIRTSHRHAYGLEKIPISQLNANIKNFPPFITPEVKELDVFRATGDNRTFVGFQKNKVFHILFIEATFGDICTH